MANGQPISVINAAETLRPHEAAGTGRRSLSWYSPEGGPNAILSGDLPELIRRSRAAYRNNGWIKQGITRHVSNEIGTHIRPLFQTKEETVKDGLNAKWPIFVKQADADGVLSFYGMLALASMTRRVAGECFIRIRPRRSSFGVEVPFQLQLLEPEMIPLSMNETRPNGNRVINGIEFNRRGQRVAYHVYNYHPYDWSTVDTRVLQTVRIPARLIMHHYRPERPGQLRGRPDTVQSLVSAFDYHEYSQSELVRKKIKATHTAFLERSEYPEDDDWLYDPMTGKALSSVDDDQTTIQPGSYNVLMPGEKVKFADGDSTGQGYADFQKWQLLSMAAGFAQPYQIFTGDLQGMNDRLWRAITNEYYRAVDIDREHLAVHQVCEPTKNMFVDMCWLAGAVDMPEFESRHMEYKQVDWQPQGRRHLQPLIDVQAKVMEMDNGLNSRTATAADLGRNAEDIDAQQEIDDERRIYPRHTNNAPWPVNSDDMDLE